jgi:hypothetical protein
VVTHPYQGKKKVGSKVQLFAEKRRGRDVTCLKTTLEKDTGTILTMPKKFLHIYKKATHDVALAGIPQAPTTPSQLTQAQFLPRIIYKESTGGRNSASVARTGGGRLAEAASIKGDSDGFFINIAILILWVIL